MKFCQNCGTSLELRIIEGRPRACCTTCQRVQYAQLKVGTGALLEREGRLLLLRRADAPFRDCWNLPAGYVEADESPAAAVVREAYEETGLRVVAKKLVDIYYFDDDPRGNGILIVYACVSTGGTLRESHEGVTPTFFAPELVPIKLAGGGHGQAIRVWQEMTAHR